MGSISALAEYQETRCPACGTAINTAATTRKRKVQCPKCREVVELGKVEALAAVPPSATAARIAELEARVLRLEALEARLAALEAADRPPDIVLFPEPLPVAPPLPPAQLPLMPAQQQPPLPEFSSATALAPAAKLSEPGRKLRWMGHTKGHRAMELPNELQDLLQQNLMAFPASSVTLRAPADDRIQWKRAELFKIIFERAKWQVSGPHHSVILRGGQGLSLAVANLPPSAEAVAVHLALTASGFGVDSVLEPSLGNGETVLIVG
jgi:phage FluMu protein Com